METIDFIPHEHDFIGWALCELLGNDKKFRKILPEGSKPVFQVEVKLNGVEVSFTQLCKLLSENYDRAVREHAIELLKERLSKITDVIYRIEQHVVGVAREEFDIHSED